MEKIGACGLTGSKSLDFGCYFDRPDDASREADLTARRHWYRFNASPQTYNQSPRYFCCYFLLQVLQEEFRVRYNPAQAHDKDFQDPKCLHPDFRDSRDLFIHGIIDGPGGTCLSMPVMYVAVGRRLGYPLKLVETRAHLFVRWEDPLGHCFHVPERFNIEGAGEGIASYADDHYRTWPEPWTDIDVAGDWYLKSLTPREELASFLMTRAACLEDNGRLADAVQAYCWARDLAPHDGRYVQTEFHRAGKLQWQREMNVACLLEANRRAGRAARRPPPFGFQGANSPDTPPHGGGCRCRDCERATRNGGTTVMGIDHGVSCHCFHCNQRRELSLKESAAAPFNGNPNTNNVQDHQCVNTTFSPWGTIPQFRGS